MANTGNRGNTAQLQAAQRCTKLRTNRQPCKAFAVRGSDPPACRRHAGKKLDVVRAEVAVREELTSWGLGHSKTDPGELLLRLVTQAALRTDAYAREIARVVAEKDGNLRKALTGDSFTAGGEGESPIKTGEYIRALTKLEADERDRAANFAAKAVAAGLAERQVRLAERQGAMLAEVIKAILGDLSLSPEQKALVSEVVPRHLRAIAA